METTAKILEKYAPQFVALDEAEKEATPLNFNSAEIEEKFTYECQLCEGSGEVEARQYINFDNLALNMCFSGIGDSVHKDQRFVEEARNQTRALLDAYAQALVKLQEQDWQPIDTAPEITAFTKIGPQLDLWSKSDGHVPNCFFDGALNVWMQRICYMGSDGQRMTQFQEVRNPTHWRPRPAPPKQEETKHETL